MNPAVWYRLEPESRPVKLTQMQGRMPRYASFKAWFPDLPLICLVQVEPGSCPAGEGSQVTARPGRAGPDATSKAQFLDLSTIFLIQGIMPRNRSPTCSIWWAALLRRWAVIIG